MAKKNHTFADVYNFNAGRLQMKIEGFTNITLQKDVGSKPV